MYKVQTVCLLTFYHAVSFQIPDNKMTINHQFYQTNTMIIYNGYFKANVFLRGRGGRDGMVVGFTTICAISAYHL